MKQSDKVQCIAETLPYIQSFRHKRFIFKVGGHMQVYPGVFSTFLEDLVLLSEMGMQIILVHGGGKEISSRLEALGLEARFVEGQRVTCPETMTEVEMVLTGKVNTSIVQELNKLGASAVGLNGKDGKMIEAKKRVASSVNGSDLGLVGEVTQVNTGVLDQMIRGGFIPVVSPVAFSREGETLNVNADMVAAAIARATQAEKLILMSDVDGLFDDFSQKDSLITKASLEEIRQMVDHKRVTAGMLPKLQGIIESLESGVASVHIINGLVEHAVLLEVFTQEGIGTMITKEG